MESENGRALFKIYLAAEDKQLMEKSEVETEALDDKKEIENQLVKKYDESVGQELRNAIERLLSSPPISQVLDIFDEAIKTIAAKEGLQIQSTGSRNPINYSVEPVGFLSSPENAKTEEKIKIVRFLNGEIVETYAGMTACFEGNSIDDIIDNLTISFGHNLEGNKYISEGLRFYRDGLSWRWDPNYSSHSGDEINPLETYAKAMAARVANRSYIKEWVEREDWYAGS